MNFLLKEFRVNGKTNISGLSGSAPRGVAPKKAIEQIEAWCGKVVLRRTNEDAQTFLRKELNNVFQNGVTVQTHEIEVKEA